jgi:MFS family permease
MNRLIGINSVHATLTGPAAVWAVAAMIGVAFAGSTLVTPLYVIYKQEFGFSQITLTLIYAAYVLGNLVALLFFGHLSDEIGRRRTILPAMTIAIASALVYLFADGVAWLYAARILSGVGIGIATGTGTAWLAELVGRRDKARATAIATSANFFGLATSALTAGVLAQYAPRPLRLPFIVYIVALLLVMGLIWRTPETVAHPHGLRSVSPHPNVSVPAEIRAAFVAPALTGFGAMALIGFFAAIGLTVLAQDLHETNHAVAGALFCEIAVIVSATILATQNLPSRTAMRLGLALMIPSVVLIVSAQVLASMWLLIVATAVCAAAAGLGYRGSLQVVNQIAPEQQRAAIVSSYFICAFLGNALPVIGIGAISMVAGAVVADTLFAALIIAFVVIALGMRRIYDQ